MQEYGDWEKQDYWINHKTKSTLRIQKINGKPHTIYSVILENRKNKVINLLGIYETKKEAQKRVKNEIICDQTNEPLEKIKNESKKH